MYRSLPLGEDLDCWLTPFVDVLRRSKRRRWGLLYVRGLLGPDGPKSVQPIAARLGLAGHDQLHHLVSSPAWDDGERPVSAFSRDGVSSEDLDLKPALMPALVPDRVVNDLSPNLPPVRSRVRGFRQADPDGVSRFG